MQTYVAEIDGRAIFAFRADDVISAQAWLDINVAMRRRLCVVETEGMKVWNGQSEIVARQATSGECTTWSRSCGDLAETEPAEGQDNITIWLIAAPEEPVSTRPDKRAARRPRSSAA